MVNIREIIIILGWLLLPGIGISQDFKNEVETAIARQEMPEGALTLLSGWLKDARKERFYQESDGEARSFEAKLWRKGTVYSVEFYEDGSLMDVEVLTRYQQLPKALRSAINASLKERYGRYKIKKTQKQYSAEEGDDGAEAIGEINEGDADDLTIRYELEIQARGSQMGSYEVLFDREGKFLQQRKIVRRSLDNLLY